MSTENRVRRIVRFESKTGGNNLTFTHYTIFCRYSADMEENANKLHFNRL